jgi:DNA polymerase-3 subunit alpha
MGMNAVAITDHGNMYGAYKFYKAVKDYNKKENTNFKGIIGCEAYIVDDLNARIFTEHIGHIVLLAKNNTGYANLCKINTKAWIDGFYKKPRIDYNFLEKHSGGLICLSACLAGHVPFFLLQNMHDEAKKYAARLKKIFGDDFYIEIQDHKLADQRDVNPKLIALARELNIPLVATNDVHYLTREDAEMQKALVCVTTKKTFDEPNEMLMPTDEFYLKSPEEMQKVVHGIGKDLDEAISNTLKIAEKCHCSPFEKADLIPEFALPPEWKKSKDMFFREQIEKGLKQKYGNPIPKHIMERYETEFAVISGQHFVDYFLIVADFMAYANSQGIATGPGRGSGAGSIIAYALGITRLDPLKYNLLFERFLHSERVSMPDFDLDFCCIRRGEVIDYVINKYGADHVCQIITFGTLAAKAAIKDIARVYKMPYSEVDKVTKPISTAPSEKPPILPYVFDLKKIDRPPDHAGEKEIDAYNKEHDKLMRLRTPELVNLYKNNPEVKKIVDMAMKVEGFPRNCSTHAAGVIICKEVVGNVTPLQRNGTDVTSQYDMKEIEELGMLKMDFLGLITLTDIQGAINDIKKYLGKTVDMYDMEYNDAAVYQMISAGDTDAVFQLESGGYKQFMKKLLPDCIEDIIAANALFRPGPMDMIPLYCRNKHNPEMTEYDHPMLEPILKTTYGQIVYQEQVMDIFRVMGGYSLGQADMVRRAMGKKDAKEMERQKDIFIHGDIKNGIKGAVANGVPLVRATQIFDKMEKFSGYAFNKSHAACYAYIAYQTAYLKYYYYEYYMANVLNNRVHKWDEMTKYIASVRKRGVDVLTPDINKSEIFFTVEKKSIRFGLAALKNVGEQVITDILKVRNSGGAFKSFGDFCNRVDNNALNKRCLESLILGGAFDNLGHTRSSLMAVYPNIVKLVTGEKRATDAGQMSMFAQINNQISFNIPNIKEYDHETKLKYEKEVVGIYLSGHPLNAHQELFEQFSFNLGLLNKEEDENLESDNPAGGEWGGNHSLPTEEKVTFGAIITDVRKMLTKSTKAEMCVLRVEDLYGGTEVMLFPKIYMRVKNEIAKDALVKIVGKISRREGENSIILADDITPLLKPENQNDAGHKLILKYNTRDETLDGEIKKILRAYSGEIPVQINCSVTNESTTQKIFVRDCRAIRFELDTHIGAENYLFR